MLLLVILFAIPKLGIKRNSPCPLNIQLAKYSIEHTLTKFKLEVLFCISIANDRTSLEQN